nr:PREDICTED: nuclear receptor subfamily 2 group C member 2 [Latimeria chalumnae]|eukprot:XP_014345024.1 PREDICTED: nuclear receptor subfamily 2 group C member 2 [Latimeria chalumnae]
MATNMEVLAQQIVETQQVAEVQTVQTLLADTPVMTSTPKRIQIISTDSTVSSPQNIQIVTGQQTSQKIQIVTTVDPSASSKQQQFILASPDGAGAGKVILSSPETSSTKQLFFTTADSLVPGRIQVTHGQRKAPPFHETREGTGGARGRILFSTNPPPKKRLLQPTSQKDNNFAKRQAGLFDPGMLVNIQQPLLRADGTVLLATDTKAETSQGDLSTLANVVTSLANLNESLNNGDTSEIQPEDQSASEITRAFDTLAKALNPADVSVGQNPADGTDSESGGGSIQVISRDQSTPIIEVEGPLLTDTHVTFKLTMPSPMPEYLNVHYICESASRLLFLSMHWARSIPAFQALGQECNTSLVRSCWNELFTLGLAQCAQVMSLSTILAAIVNHLQNSIQEDKLSGDKIKQVMEHIWKLQEFCNSMTKLDIDGYEYAYLKAIVLFSPDHPGLSNTGQIEKFQEKAQMELQDYVQKSYSEDTYRLARILVRLPALRLLNSSITEELFFTGLIGNVPIDSIIPYILKMETDEYNSQITGTSA